MTCRTESSQVWVHDYNAENRISAVYKMDGTDCASQGSATHTWLYTYDGDGTRVLEEYYVGITLTMTKYYFAGGAYEIQDDGSTQTTLKYYNIAGMMVAMDNGSDLVYFASDHLSSTSIVMNASGGLESQNRYLPFGQVRDNISDSPIDETDFGYTGQRNLADIGLMDYRSRFYSPSLMRFTQPDTIVSNPINPQSWNRYSYVNNSPIIYNDPSGHSGGCPDRMYCRPRIWVPSSSCLSTTSCYESVIERAENWAGAFINGIINKYGIDVPEEVTIKFDNESDASTERTAEYKEETNTLYIYPNAFFTSYGHDPDAVFDDAELFFASIVYHETIHAKIDIYADENPESDLAKLREYADVAYWALGEIVAYSKQNDFLLKYSNIELIYSMDPKSLYDGVVEHFYMYQKIFIQAMEEAGLDFIPWTNFFPNDFDH